MNMKLDTILFCIAFIVCQNINISAASNDIDDVHERNKRFVFLRGAGMGYIVALAIPTNSVNKQRVYVAFNFEAHFGLADSDTFLTKLKMPFIGDDISRQAKREVHGSMIDNRFEHFSGKKNVYTRKNLYRILEKQINSYGYNGTSCLLRTICETAETPFYEYNGVFGNILHILFTPSSSKPENIRSIYYEAEYHGQLQECHRYLNDCNISFLDLVSDIISVKLRKML